MSISAVLCGTEGWEEIADFGNARLQWLRQHCAYTNEFPKHDTIARVLSHLEPKALQESFISWVSAAGELSEGEIVAIDGKPLGVQFKRESAVALFTVSVPRPAKMGWC